LGSNEAGLLPALVGSRNSSHLRAFALEKWRRAMNGDLLLFVAGMGAGGFLVALLYSVAVSVGFHLA
jgi:hypothetical protein